MNKIITVKKISFLLILIFIGSTVSTISHAMTDDEYILKAIELTQEFSKPIINDEGEYLKVSLENFDSFILDSTKPMLPDLVKTFEFSPGTEISDVKVSLSEIHTTDVSKKVKPTSYIQQVGKNIATVDGITDLETYSNADPYPSNWFYYEKGAGINKNGDHVLYLTLHLYPVRYLPSVNVIQYVEKMDIHISYEEPIKTSSLTTTYDLVIIAPSEFYDDIQPLIEHKNNYDVDTYFETLEDIYSSFSGRDEAEQIKYFIKYALDEWNIKYVLLIGDIDKLPIRSTDSYPWGNDFGGDILSDLYYADVYNENFSFCNWDYNNNNIFGEIDFGGGFFTDMDDIDAVDLYPDVGVGRIPCTTSEELQTVIEKIITYERYTYDQLWFKKIILVGGDTFPLSKGSPPFVYEGEITNEKVAQQLPDFEHIKLWASKRNLNARNFNKAINEGAGFLSYAGHGFEHGWGTYRPNALQNRMGFTHPLYYTPFIRFIRNQNKLPIIFFDACLTTKLDFNISDLHRYYPITITLLLTLTNMQYDISDYYPCFAWSFLSKENGGAIATIGATRPAYTYVDKDGVYAGAGYLDISFFKAYEEGVAVSQMFTQAQNDYINNVGKDYFTIEEYMLLGDPSLMVGGYP